MVFDTFRSCIRRDAGYGLLEISFVIILILGVTLSLADMLRLYNGQRIAKYAADSGVEFALSRYFKIQNNGLSSLNSALQNQKLADLKFSTISHVIEFVDVTGSITNVSCATVSQMTNSSHQRIVNELQSKCCSVGDANGCIEILVELPDAQTVKINFQHAVQLIMLDTFLGRYLNPIVSAVSLGKTTYVSQSGRPNLQNNRP